MAFYTRDNSRDFISVIGPDAASFLQGLITNDIQNVSQNNSIYTALLTPQGKYLFDFFILKISDGYLLDIDQARTTELMTMLRKYKLRSDVLISDISETYHMSYLFGDEIASLQEAQDKISYLVDPRLADLGIRVLSSEPYYNDSYEYVEPQTYDLYRLSLGIPKGSVDMLVDKAIPLECGLDELNAIAWNKGCYLGQELTARTKHRGLVRKRLLPFTFEGDFIEPLISVTLEGEEIGTTRTAINGFGIARIRLDALEKQGIMTAGSFKITVKTLPWMKLSQ